MTAQIQPTPDWAEHERPLRPGSPSTPDLPPLMRLAYGLVAVLVGVTGSLGNALLTANLPTIQGQLGLTPAEGAWLPAAYVMFNVTANLLIYKFRQQYGMRLFAEIGLGLYALLTLLHLAVGSFGTTLALRAGSGFAGAACSSLCTLYMLQAMSKPYMGKMLVLALGISQLATPLAWLLSPSLLNEGLWHNLYLFEAGLALCAFAAVVVLKLPPGVHIRAFERLDFLTFALMAPAVAMVVAVLAQGYVRWWLDTAWLAWLLIAALVLLVLALFIEHHRRHPLLQTRWLMSGMMLRFMLGSLLIRFLTSEQTVGAVGLLRLLGMGTDQMQPLFAVILAGTLIGLIGCTLSFGPKTLLPQLLIAILLFAIAGWLDHRRSSLDRPEQFFFSQFLVAVGSGIFLGPLLLLGIQRAVQLGSDHIVTFIVMFSITQSLGGLAGSAALTSYELHREQVYSAAIVAEIDPAEAAVAQRLRQQQQTLAATVADPTLRAAQGTAQLAAVARREAHVRAYNDVFALSALMAVLFLIWTLILSVRLILRSRAAAPTAPA